MKSTIQLNQDDFDNQSKKLVVITSNEQSLILQSVESLKNQAEVLQSLLRVWALITTGIAVIAHELSPV